MWRGGTDLDMLRALADRMGHPVAALWDERINSFYVQNNYPVKSLESELERVEGGFGITPKEHFFALRNLVPGLQGIAILDNDGQNRQPFQEGGLNLVYWKRYEAENYFITPDVLRRFALEHYKAEDLLGGFSEEIEAVIGQLILERIFGNVEADFITYRTAASEVARLLWEAKTERLKLSDFAEEFFRQLANKLSHPMILRKGELHRLVIHADPNSIPVEVKEKLDLLQGRFQAARDRDVENEFGI